MDKIIERKVNAAVKNVTNEFENKVISLENQVYSDTKSITLREHFHFWKGTHSMF